MRRVAILLILMIGGCQSDGEQATVAWLQTQGFSLSAAESLASNKPELRKLVMDQQSSEADDRYCKSLGARTGTDAYVQCRVATANNRSSQVEAKRDNDALRRDIAVAAQPAPDSIRAPEIAPMPSWCAKPPCS